MLHKSGLFMADSDADLKKKKTLADFDTGCGFIIFILFYVNEMNSNTKELRVVRILLCRFLGVYCVLACFYAGWLQTDSSQKSLAFIIFSFLNMVSVSGGMGITLNASLRWNSSLAISSPTQLGMSGIATWMIYFKSTAKCCSWEERENVKVLCVRQETENNKSLQYNSKSYKVNEVNSEGTSHLLAWFENWI